MDQIGHLQYLQHLLFWTRHMQQQFDMGKGTGAREQEQWYARFNYFVQDIEETIKQPYSLQHDDILTFHRQADELYHEALGMYQDSRSANEALEQRKHYYVQPPDQGAAAPTQHQSPHIKATFRALVDTMIPSTAGIFGAVDLQMDEYLIMILDRQIAFQENWTVKTVHLSTPAAVTLDIAAAQLLAMKDPYFTTPSEEGVFASLSHADRIEAVRLLENLQIDLGMLPSPFTNNGELVRYIVTYVFQMVKFGYYSEWHAYGSTRFAAPEDRVLEGFPYTWNLVGYPGVSLGYRALRGFLVDEFTEEVK